MQIISNGKIYFLCDIDFFVVRTATQVSAVCPRPEHKGLQVFFSILLDIHSIKVSHSVLMFAIEVLIT